MNNSENQSKLNILMRIVVGIFAVIGAFASIVQILEWFGISPKKK